MDSKGYNKLLKKTTKIKQSKNGVMDIRYSGQAT